MKRGRNQRRRQGVNPNRAYDSNGPDVRIRGTANQIYDKYLSLARDAASSGDRVKAENYLQHAEHYFRLIRSMQPNQATANDGADSDAAGENQDQNNRSGGDRANQQDRSNNRDRRNSRPERRGQEEPGDENDVAAESADNQDDAPSEVIVDMPAEEAEEESSVPSVEAEEKPRPRRGRPPSRSSENAKAESDDKPATRRRRRPRKAEAAEEETAPVPEEVTSA